MSNIRDIRWEEGITTEKEYRLKKYFYGNLNKVSEVSIRGMDFKDEVDARGDSTSSDDIGAVGLSMAHIKGGGEIKPESFGWKEGYDKEMRDYLERGYESFKIYDEQYLTSVTNCVYNKSMEIGLIRPDITLY